MNKTMNIVQIPFTLGSHRKGCDLGPKAIQHAGIKELFIEKNYTISEQIIHVSEREDAKEPTLKNLTSVCEMAESVGREIDHRIKMNEFPLILGGDHSISLGTIAGIAKHYPNLGVIWVDAHGDVNTNQTTLTGNIHGMPLAANMGFGHEKLTNILKYSPKIKPENVVILGARDLDPGEIKLLESQHITYFTHHDIEHHGIKKIMKAIESKFKSNQVESLHLSFDLDSLDPSVVKGVGTPVDAGLTFREASYLLSEIKRWDMLISCEFVEVNPLLDEGNKTAEIAVQLIRELF
jgi:arginase